MTFRANTSVVAGALALAVLIVADAARPFARAGGTGGGQAAGAADLDARVQAYLVQREGTWRDLNVPAVDGKTLHDLILEHRFTRALEIRHVHGAFGPLDRVGPEQDGRAPHDARN